jgi:hypothetical protein
LTVDPGTNGISMSTCVSISRYRRNLPMGGSTGPGLGAQADDETDDTPHALHTMCLLASRT